MGDERNADEWSAELRRGVDPRGEGGARGHEMARAILPADRQPLSAVCVRSAYDAIALAAADADDLDGDTLTSVRAGAEAASTAARVGEEIGAGSGSVLRAAARAWTPFAVHGQEKFWHDAIRAFSDTCDAVERSDQWVIVEAVRAASGATRTDDSSSARAARVFTAELVERTQAGESLPSSWARAVDRTREDEPDPVLLLVVEAVARVLREGAAPTAA